MLGSVWGLSAAGGQVWTTSTWLRKGESKSSGAEPPSLLPAKVKVGQCGTLRKQRSSEREGPSLPFLGSPVPNYARHTVDVSGERHVLGHELQDRDAQ